MRTNLVVIYILWRSRCGKTSSVYKHFSPAEIYRVTNYKHPFDSYGQKVLVLMSLIRKYQLINF